MPHFTSSDGAAIEFQRSGEGPAVIVVDGAFEPSGDRPDRGHPRPSGSRRDHRLPVRPPGRGLSGDVRPYAVEREVEDIDGLIAVAGGAACVMGARRGRCWRSPPPRPGSPSPGWRCTSRRSSSTTAARRCPAITWSGCRPRRRRPPGRRRRILHDRGDGTAGRVVTGARESPMWPELEAVAHTLPYDGAIMGDTMYGDPSPLRAVGGDGRAHAGDERRRQPAFLQPPPRRSPACCPTPSAAPWPDKPTTSPPMRWLPRSRSSSLSRRDPPPPSDDRDSTIVVDVAALAAPDAATIDALARLQLVATADGRQTAAAPRLARLVA